MEKKTIFVKQIYLEDFEKLISIFNGYFGKSKIFADGYEVYDLKSLYSRKLKKIRLFRITAENHKAMLSIKSGITRIILKDIDKTRADQIFSDFDFLINKYRSISIPSLFVLDIILLLGSIATIILAPKPAANRIVDFLGYFLFFLGTLLFSFLKRRNSIILIKSGDKE